MQKKIKVFHLCGGIDYSKLGFIDRILMNMLYSSIKRKNHATLSSEDKGIIATYGKAVDFTNISTLMPIVEYVKGL